MKRVTWLLALVGAVLLSACPVPADDLYVVVGARPAPGTKITSLPYEIKTSGYYYLTGNLTNTNTGAGGGGITVSANDVTLDLMGFTLTGPGSETGYLDGILLTSDKINVEVRNGTVSGWYSGVEQYNGSTGTHHRVIGIRANGNTYGVWLGGSNHLIKGCTASQGTFGSGTGLRIAGTGTISDSTVRGFSYDGIYIGGGKVSGNLVLNCPGKGIVASAVATISDNSVSNCGAGTGNAGISGAGGGSITGNAVLANTGQTGVLINNGNMFDQNSLSGAGTHWAFATGLTSWLWASNGY